MKKNKLYGVILGDLCGQPYEFKYKGDYSEFNIHDPKSKFTDDTLMTLATAKALIEDKPFEDCYKEIGLKYEGDYYGPRFKEWLKTPKGTVGNSYANGCLMRVSPCIYLDKSIALQKAVESCFCSHLNSDSIISVMNLMMLYKDSKLREISSKYNSKKYLQLSTEFDVTASGTFKFIEHAYWLTNSTQKTIEKVVKCGGDTDTNASIIGELMNYTFDDLTEDNISYVRGKLDSYLLEILDKFNNKFNG